MSIPKNLRTLKTNFEKADGLGIGGCGGHPMRPKLNLKDKGQISKPNEYTDNFKSSGIFRQIFENVLGILMEFLGTTWTNIMSTQITSNQI